MKEENDATVLMKEAKNYFMQTVFELSYIS